MATYLKSEITKKNIFNKANQLFSEQGYNSTGIDQIVKSIGMTSGVFYNHYISKSELLAEVIQTKIKNSEDTMLAVQNKESAVEWVVRVLKLYLSTEHRDSKTQSCPLTTLSTELIQLRLQEQTGLLQYTQKFTEILQRRLLIISADNKDKAHSIVSLCVGAVLLARLETDSVLSQKILDQAYDSCVQLILPQAKL